MLARIQQDDQAVPERQGRWWYATRTRTGDAARRIDRPRMAARNPTAGKNQGPRSRAADPNPRNTADRERMFESFTEADVDTTTFALFGDATFDFTDRLSLSIGAQKLHADSQSQSRA